MQSVEDQGLERGESTACAKNRQGNDAAPLSKKKRLAAHKYQHHGLPRLILNLHSTWCHKQHTGRGDRGGKDLGEAGDINVLRIQTMESCGTTF